MTTQRRRAAAMSRAVLVLAIALAMFGQAQAQTVRWAPERTTAGWVFTPGILLGGGWDSNVTIQNEGNPQLHEWIGLVNPRGEIDFNGRRTHLNLGYSGALEAYRTLSELQRYEQRAKLELRQTLSRRFLFEGTASYAAVPTTDRLEVPGEALPFIDIGSQLLDVSSRVQFRMSARTRIDGEYRFQQVRFDQYQVDAPNQFLRGGYSHEPAIRIVHDATSRLSFSGGWAIRHANLQKGVQTFDVYTGDGDVSYLVRSSTKVIAGAGASRLSVSNTAVSTWGPTFHGALEQRAARTLLSARYDRSFVPSFGFGGLTATQTLTGSAHVPFGANRYYVDGGVSYGRTNPVEALGLGYRLDSVWINGSVGYRVSRWLAAEGFVSNSHQNSTARGNVDRTRVGVQFVTAKPVRIQ